MLRLRNPSRDVSKEKREFMQIRPSGGARLIIADPPWKFKDWSNSGDKTRNPEFHYEVQDIAWIQALPVEMLAAKNAILIMWATNPMLPQAIDVMEYWGFRYCTAGTWVKRTTKNGLLGFGTGHVLRSSNEPFLIGMRGSVKVPKNIRSAIVSVEGRAGRRIEDHDPWASIGVTIEAKLRDHSRKPDSFHEMARQLVPDGPAIELFGRQQREGWTVWGNEADKFNAA